jgi:HAD domain in Swiss Army Knife RNA repair proteins
MSRILFLDVDGVLNSRRSEIAYTAGVMPSTPGLPPHFNDIDWVAVGMILTLCKRLSVEIVVSSSWRETFKHEDLARMFKLPIIDAIDNEAGTRGDQIQRWLNAHPEVEQYAIVDDNSGMLASQQDHFVQTDWDEGLTYKECARLRDILQGIFTEQPRKRANFILFDEI